MPGAIRPGSPGIGIALKISDGDLKGRARPAVSLEILRQLGAISVDELAELTKFGPNFDLYNWRKIHVGAARPVFIINKP
jgi:L-asparaginase II